MAPKKKKTERAADQDEDALDALVNQFADPMSFVRELVQNSIDAGSVEIAVSCEWRPTAGQVGTAIIHVDDFGLGMDRHIIETKLTRLFSSDKEGDLTKIGKFGIGFVSVFAIVPDAVCVDTGRGGESWRVLFRRDRSFSLIRLAEPIEGTKIQVIKQMSEPEYRALLPRVRGALHFHCKHVDVALRFSGEPITEAFDLPDALIKERDKSDLAEIVMGILPSQAKPILGFYNRGLTLLERPSDVPSIGCKIQSSYLEHTLSRDSVVQDRNYSRIMLLRERLLRGPFLRSLMRKLDALLKEGAPPDQVLPYHASLAALVIRGCTAPADCEDLAVATSITGLCVCLPELSSAAAYGKLVHARAKTPLVDGLIKAGGCVCPAWQAQLVAAMYRAGSGQHGESDAPDEDAQNAYAIEQRFVLPLPFHTSDRTLKKRIAALCAATQKLLRQSREKTASVAMAQLDYEGSSLRGAISVVMPAGAYSLASIPRGQDSLDGTLVIDAEHKQLQPLLPLCDREPELAAYTLLKLCLFGQVTAERDSAFLTAAMETRWRRMNS